METFKSPFLDTSRGDPRRTPVSFPRRIFFCSLLFLDVAAENSANRSEAAENRGENRLSLLASALLQPLHGC